MPSLRPSRGSAIARDRALIAPGIEATNRTSMAAAEIQNVSLDDVVCAAKAQVSRRLGDEVAILHVDKAVFYQLDPVGARVWELVAKPIAVRAVLDAVLAEYEVDAETAERDVLELVGQLLEAGLVERRDASAP